MTGALRRAGSSVASSSGSSGATTDPRYDRANASARPAGPLLVSTSWRRSVSVASRRCGVEVMAVHIHPRPRGRGLIFPGRPSVARVVLAPKPPMLAPCDHIFDIDPLQRGIAHLDRG